jgi:hypothetical protein
MSVFRDEKIWRVLTNFWTVIFILFLIANFFLMNKYDYLVAPFSVLYVAVLSLYVGTKEFDRWYELYEGKHPGELFVVAWTIVIFGLIILSLVLGEDYKVSSEAIADYIMVLSIFALTQKSKSLYREKKLKSQARKNESENQAF